MLIATPVPSASPSASPSAAPSASPSQSPTPEGYICVPSEYMCPYSLMVACYHMKQGSSWDLTCVVDDLSTPISPEAKKHVVDLMTNVHDNKFYYKDDTTGASVTLAGQEDADGMKISFTSETSCCMPEPTITSTSNGLTDFATYEIRMTQTASDCLTYQIAMLSTKCDEAGTTCTFPEGHSATSGCASTDTCSDNTGAIVPTEARCPSPESTESLSLQAISAPVSSCPTNSLCHDIPQFRMACNI